MITQWVVQAAVSVGQWFVTLLPSFDIPDWFVGLGDDVNSLFSNAAGLGPLVDWSLVAGIAAVPMGLWVGGLVFKSLRVLLSHIPFFGGR